MASPSATAHKVAVAKVDLEKELADLGALDEAASELLSRSKKTPFGNLGQTFASPLAHQAAVNLALLSLLKDQQERIAKLEAQLDKKAKK